MTPKAQALAQRVFRLLAPPPKIRLSEWADDGNIVLPDGQSARPGRYKTWPYMREIFDCIGDEKHENVTILKAARVGYTKALAVAIGAKAKLNPGNMMLLMPTDEDATEISQDEIEPLFSKSPVLRNIIKPNGAGRSTLRTKLFTGGSLKIRSAFQPRKLRRLTIRDLFIDEADAMGITKEGDPIYIAEQRTRSYHNRKIVVGSTPTEEDISLTEGRYKNSDQRVYMVPCPHPTCGEFSELMWEDMQWEKDDLGRPIHQTIKWQCPKCRNLIHERFKAVMVENGRWVKMNPEVKDHAGFRLSALISLLPKASWAQLCKEWYEAKKSGPSKEMVFVNTVLGRSYSFSKVKVDAGSLEARAEPFGAPAHGRREFTVPPEVLMLLVGSDTQDDRIEATVLGISLRQTPFVLGHYVFEGDTLQPEVWRKFDQWHRDFVVRHPNGWQMRIDAMAVDSGGREGRTQVVYEWCAPRLTRAIYAIKGDDGPNKKMIADAKKIKGDVKLKIVGVDQCKTAIMAAYGKLHIDENGVIDPHAMRFSDSLPPEYYEQLTNERRLVRYNKQSLRAIIEFKPKRAGLRVEALDCCVYAWSLQASPAITVIDLKARSERRVTPPPAQTSAEATSPPPRKRPTSWAEKFNS